MQKRLSGLLVYAAVLTHDIVAPRLLDQRSDNDGASNARRAGTCIRSPTMEI